MVKAKLADRVTALEAEVARLLPWWKQIAGTFANDPMHAEAMRLGREYRESFPPKPKKRRETSAPGKRKAR